MVKLFLITSYSKVFTQCQPQCRYVSKKEKIPLRPAYKVLCTERQLTVLRNCICAVPWWRNLWTGPPSVTRSATQRDTPCTDVRAVAWSLLITRASWPWLLTAPAKNHTTWTGISCAPTSAALARAVPPATVTLCRRARLDLVSSHISLH